MREKAWKWISCSDGMEVRLIGIRWKEAIGEGVGWAPELFRTK
jgi:hypothetical protein